MNVLSPEERVLVASALVDGCSLRATERIAGVSRPAINTLLLRLGAGCGRLLDAMMRGLHCDVLELDELWCFVGKKEARVVPGDPEEFGDSYTWVALDARTKLVPVHRVEKRTTAACIAFAAELRARVVGAPQITTDGHKAYLDAIERAFGARVHFAQIIKEYRGDESGGASRDDVRYSRGRVVRSIKRPIIGTPDEERVSTSFVERCNLTTRMGVRRFTRLTNAFSKRLENLRAAVALHFAHYNLCRVHQTLRVTPAMEAGLTDRVWSLTELLATALAAPVPPPLPPPEAPPAPKPPAPPPGPASKNVVLPGQLPLFPPGVL